MDAITQLIESYISRKAKPLPQALAIAGLKLAVPVISLATGAARQSPLGGKHCANAAPLSGTAPANSGLGLCMGWPQPWVCIAAWRMGWLVP